MEAILIDRAAHRTRLIDTNRGITGLMKLLGQISILDERIREHLGVCLASPKPSRRISEMLLDTETFYTVAADALKTIQFFYDAVRTGSLQG